MTSGKTFEIEELAKVLCYQNEKYSILYNKYFYGFEKEGKSSYFLSNSVQGYYFKYKYPFKEDLVASVLTKALNVPLNSQQLASEIKMKT